MDGKVERAVLDDLYVGVILIKRKSRHDAFRRLVMESHDHEFIVRGCFTGSEDGVFCRPLRGCEGWMCRPIPFERQPQRASQGPGAMAIPRKFVQPSKFFWK